MTDPAAAETHSNHRYWSRLMKLTAGLLAIWIGATFGVSFFARQLNSITFLGFPLGFYMSAQGSLLIYLALVAIYACCANRVERELDPVRERNA